MELIREIYLILRERGLQPNRLTRDDARAMADMLVAKSGTPAADVMLDCINELNELYRQMWKLEDRVASLEQNAAAKRPPRRLPDG